MRTALKEAEPVVNESRPASIEGIELYDPDVFLHHGVPHDDFTRLRRECPVYFHENEEPGGPGYWAITKYDDIVRISSDPKVFSSKLGSNIKDYDPEDLSQIQLLMINMDPPQHHQFRRLVRMGFTPRMVKAMEVKVRARVNKIFDRIAGKEHCDFVREVSAELPLQVIADLLGVPEEDEEKLFDWSNRLIGFDDPEFQTSMDDARMAAFEVWQYAEGLANERRGKDGEQDLVRVLINAEIEGEKLTDMEFDSFFLLLAVAGNETTRNAISQGMRTLLEYPEQMQRLRDDRSLLPSAVEEMLRFTPPVLYFRRTVTEDVVVRHQRLREGDKLALYYPSANRDEDHFENAHVFDIGRTPNDHLAFGVGEHFCMGASLARLEMNLFFEELLRRFDDWQHDGQVRRLRSNFIGGIKEMPLSFTTLE
jgi:cholest-4-en-3-one 26-monooxygenase